MGKIRVAGLTRTTILMSSIYDRLWDAVPRPVQHVAAGGSFWRKEPPEIVDKVVTKGGMFEPQREFYELPNFIKILVAGYGSGKSWVLCKRMIALAIQNAPIPCAIVVPSYAMAKLTTLPTIRMLLDGKRSLYGRAFWWGYNGMHPPHFSFRFRGRDASLYIISSERPLSLRGSNLAAAGLEEPFIQPQAAFDQMIARVRHPAAKKREIVIAGTPEQLNWGYELCEGELRDRYDVGFVQAGTESNLALPSEYAKTLERGYDALAWKAYGKGEFVNLTTGRVYHSFDRREHVVERERPSGSKLGLGMDFNVDPMAFSVFWYKGDEMHVMREYELPNSDTEFACQTVRADFGDELENVFPDPTGRNRATNAPGGVSDFTILRRQGFTVYTRGQYGRRDRFNAVNGKFKPARGLHTITISPTCKKLIKYFTQYTYEQMRKQEDMSHLLDATTYPIAYLWPIARMAITEMKYHGA